MDDHSSKDDNSEHMNVESDGDILLLEAVGLYEAQGKGRFVDWGKVVVFLKERGYVRSYEQCKQKWNKTLKPKLGGEVNCEPWKADEDIELIAAVRNSENLSNGFGKYRINWLSVAQSMTGNRSPQKCKRRWHETLKPKLLLDTRYAHMLTRASMNNEFHFAPTQYTPFDTRSQMQHLMANIRQYLDPRATHTHTMSRSMYDFPLLQSSAQSTALRSLPSSLSSGSFPLSTLDTYSSINGGHGSAVPMPTTKHGQNYHQITSEWQDEEDSILINAVSSNICLVTHGYIDWVDVATNFYGYRTPSQCIERWNYLLTLLDHNTGPIPSLPAASTANLLFHSNNPAIPIHEIGQRMQFQSSHLPMNISSASLQFPLPTSQISSSTHNVDAPFPLLHHDIGSATSMITPLISNAMNNVTGIESGANINIAPSFNPPPTGYNYSTTSVHTVHTGESDSNGHSSELLNYDNRSLKYSDLVDSRIFSKGKRRLSDPPSTNSTSSTAGTISSSSSSTITTTTSNIDNDGIYLNNRRKYLDMQKPLSPMISTAPAVPSSSYAASSSPPSSTFQYSFPTLPTALLSQTIVEMKPSMPMAMTAANSADSLLTQEEESSKEA